MNWDAIGATAEIAGVFAVVVSVLYLAKQVKIGNDLNRTHTFRDIMYGMTAHINLMFGQENIELMIKGLKNYESLPAEEKLRFEHLVAGLFQYAEDSWNSSRVGLLGPETIDNWSWFLKTKIFPYEGALEWWAEYKPAYALEFQSWIDSVVQLTKSSDDPYGIKD
jgi:hypothetical protein